MKDQTKNIDRLINADSTEQSENFELNLRPKRLNEFIGQPQVQKNLSTFISAASSRKEAMDHALLFGPPGLGKTTLAQIISCELGVGFRSTSGPIINKAGDLAAAAAWFLDEQQSWVTGQILSVDGGLANLKTKMTSKQLFVDIR